MKTYNFNRTNIIIKFIYTNKRFIKLDLMFLTKELIEIIKKYIDYSLYENYLKEGANRSISLSILPNYEIDELVTDIKDYCMENNLSLKIVN